MKNSLLFALPFLFLPFAIHAQSNEFEAVKAVIKAPSLIPKGSIDGSCYQCKESMDSGATEDLFCKDLFASSCLNTDGTSKFQGKYSASGAQLKLKLSEARNMAAAQMGFKDFKEAVVKNIKEAGLNMPEDLTDSQLTNLLQESEDYSGSVEIKYPDVVKCEESEVSDSILNGQIDYAKSITQLKAKREKFRVMQIKAAVANLPNFLNAEFSSPCDSLKNSPEKYPEVLNVELADKCRKFPSIRAEAINIFRQENTPQYKGLAEEFIIKNQLPILYEKNSDEEKDKSDLYNEYKNQRSQSYNICNSLKGMISSSAQKIARNLATDLSKSKPVVEHMVASYYSAQRKAQALELLKYTKENIKKLIPKITKDPKKIKNITTGYDRLKLAWLDNPVSSEYEKSSTTGLMTLKENDDSNNEAVIAFSDQRLSYFTEINAFYTPLMMEGDSVAAIDTVHMMPFFLQQLDDNKYSFLSVLAHEAGHKIGPLVSKMNGHDLRSEWKDLIACYKNTDSIKLGENQKDETIADYISSEVLSDAIAKLPVNEKRKAFANSMGDFCLFNDQTNCTHSVYEGDAHPENILRINGIYGANPHLRSAIGCKGESADYRSCSLK